MFPAAAEHSADGQAGTHAPCETRSLGLPSGGYREAAFGDVAASGIRSFPDMRSACDALACGVPAHPARPAPSIERRPPTQAASCTAHGRENHGGRPIMLDSYRVGAAPPCCWRMRCQGP